MCMYKIWSELKIYICLFTKQINKHEFTHQENSVVKIHVQFLLKKISLVIQGIGVVQSGAEG